MPIAEKSSDDILNLIGLITGKSGSSSGSTTQSGTKTSSTQANITKEGMQSLINDILAGPGGVASIGAAEKAAGLYGGSTGVLLQNDLVARTAAKLAAAQAGTTTTETTSGDTTSKGRTDQDPTIDPLKALGGIAGVSLLNSLLQGAGVGGISGVTGSISDLIKAGGSGLAGLIGGAAGGNPGYTVDPNGMTTNMSGLTPQQIEAQAGDLSGLTNIPISSLFPSNDTNLPAMDDWNFGGDSGGWSGSDNEDYAPGD